MVTFLKSTLCLQLFASFAASSLSAIPLEEQFQRVGYSEICNELQDEATFDSLYARFDELMAFLQTNPKWAQKLSSAKERFIRSKARAFYSTDFFGFYDESERKGRRQISFYYSVHFHEFICSCFPEFNQIPELMGFLNVCHEVQRPCADLFKEAASELGVGSIFASSPDHPPVLFKVVKYLPAYTATKPHYDGTAFSLFLDSTDSEALLLSPYKTSFTVEDFFCPPRNCSQKNSFLLIPGALLTEFSIYPTPHIVMQSGTVRYAAVAFAMRPHYVQEENALSALPDGFSH